MPEQKNQTDIYHLPLYTDKDKPNLRDQYGRSMDIIDKTLDKQNTDISSAQSTANNAVSYANSNKNILDALGAVDTTSASTIKNHEAEQDSAISANNSQTSKVAEGLSNAKAALQQQIDEEKTARQHDFTALGGRIDSSDSNISGLQTDVQNLKQSLAHTTRHWLAIGDSYGSQKGNSWAVELQKIIGGTMHNYCQPGYGFVTSTGTYSQEIDTAVDDKTYPHDEVDYIIVAGSRNDLKSDGSIHSAANALFSRIHTNFPTATVVVVPMLWDYRPMPDYWHTNAAEILTAAAANDCVQVPWAWTWLLGESGYFSGNDIHPNNAGCKVIARYIAQAIKGSYAGRYCYQINTGSGQSNGIVMTFAASAGLISYGIRATDSSTLNVLTGGIDLPGWAQKPGEGDQTGAYTWGTIPAQGSDSSVSVFIRDKISIRGTASNGQAVAANIGGFITMPW